jgi:hypothetical protein
LGLSGDGLILSVSSRAYDSSPLKTTQSAALVLKIIYARKPRKQCGPDYDLLCEARKREVKDGFPHLCKRFLGLTTFLARRNSGTLTFHIAVRALPLSLSLAPFGTVSLLPSGLRSFPLLAPVISSRSRLLGSLYIRCKAPSTSLQVRSLSRCLCLCSISFHSHRQPLCSAESLIAISPQIFVTTLPPSQFVLHVLGFVP